MADVKRLAGGSVSTVSVDESVYGEKVRRRLLHEAVLMYEANQRVGTASTKGRSDVSGSHRKLWRQKGTGRARPGNVTNPVWRGGGTMFGPKPRDFSYSMPKKALRQALRSALLSKFRDGEVCQIDGLSFDAPSTKKAAQLVDLAHFAVSELREQRRAQGLSQR
ncbi:MAG: 50S ribosomal protein L4, partial [Planctomycetota bacterium]